MAGTTHSSTPARAEVRMVAQPASVPAARRFVNDLLEEWGWEAVAEDVSLCVSELATNSTLHSGSVYFQVELEQRPDAVRLAVADAGMGSVEVLAQQPTLSDALLDDLSADDTCATGRGMFLVCALAASWGIDELASGTRIWADFLPSGPASEDADPTAAEVTRSEARPPTPLDPDAWAVVRFRDCPAALLVAHDDNLAEFTRELQLLGDRLAEPAYQRLAQQMAGYVQEHAANWDPARIAAREAVREGRDLIDVDVLCSREVAPSLRTLRGLIHQAEELARQDRLMTLPAPEPVQRLRNWLEGEFIAQVHAGAAPLPFGDWLAGVRR
ncbi:ATP-binding protein [Nocardioides terrisoli]|uniref:ATP-binding protein n=1 Tax=Nocardioides terrisoli TaxID=3388267 RepID=UPI00287B6F34|nr:ATP-binding protein [Nocardioides marmorisolisilvae]